jgi:uracil-DNA glycosylase
LEHGPRPIISVSAESKILIIGQAPGRFVHESGIPWDDKSGENLRAWMDIDSETFYDPNQIGIVPMGFCYPGKGKSGDLPPRKECAPLWHPLLFKELKKVRLTLLIGKYAQDYYLKSNSKSTLTETVKNFKNYLPQYLVLPHPSPRNNIWQAKNKWFQTEVIPNLQLNVRQILIQ